MIKIKPDKEGFLTQWDKNRTVIISGIDDEKVGNTVVHFSSPNDSQNKAHVLKAYVDDDGLVRAEFPNIFLTFPGRVDVNIYTDDHTCAIGVLVVMPHEKPDDYIYEETEVLKYETLEKQIGNLDDLKTTAKGDLVSAINEAMESGGGGKVNAGTMTGATADTDGAAGLVPAPKAGEQDKFLRGDGTWAETATGGVSNPAVEPAEDDIPKVFFGGPLQQTKDAAVVPYRYISKTQDISCYAEIKAQGNSSMSYPKKNQTVKLYKDAECTEKLKVDFKGWGMQNKHVYKANWIDLSHARNVVSARLWADIVKSRSNYSELPEELRTSPNQGVVDGFPVKVYANGIYQGRYTLNIPKDKWMTNMDDTLETHCILCGENYVSGCFRAAANINGNDWTDEIHDTVPDSIKTRWNDVISFVMNSTDEEFRANLGDYFDVQSLIDYHLFGLQSCGLDAYGKNQLYLTYDGQKWIASIYDMDSTWGLYWNGSKFVATDYARTSYEDFVSTQSNGEGNLLYIRLEQCFYAELQARWTELKNGALSIENIINRFERFTDIAPSELVKEDYASTTGGGAFTGIPSQSTNNIQQIRAFALARQAWCDEYIVGLTPVEEVPCTGISLSAETLIFTGAGTQTLTATVEPDGCTDAVTWESSNTGIVTVSEGIVTAVGNGDAIITAICGGFSATCAVSISGIISEEASLVYSLPESTTFDGATYIDTGIQLFDTLKDFTILFDYEDGDNGTSATIFHCIKETHPYPGICMQRKGGNTGYFSISGYAGTGFSFAYIHSAATRVAITCTGGSITGVKYTQNGDIVTNSISANSGTIFEKNLLLGCYQNDSGNKGRYWKGTINKFDVYFTVLSDEEIDAWLTE